MRQVRVLALLAAAPLVLGAEHGPKADPPSTTYGPRPEWYFFFLFELLRVIKPPELVPIATIGIPTICMVLLLLLPFYDRGPERNPVRRPIATTAGVMTIVAMAYLSFLGATGGSPTEIDMKVAPQYEAGKEVVRHGVRIVGHTNLPATMPASATQMYAKNLHTLIKHLVRDGSLDLDFEDEITKGATITVVTKAGTSITVAIAMITTMQRNITIGATLTADTRMSGIPSCWARSTSELVESFSRTIQRGS